MFLGALWVTSTPPPALAVGQISFGGCVADDASAGCTAVGAGRLTGAISVAVRPDGNSLYVASLDANAVSHFFVAPHGQLTFGGCVADDATAGCTAVGAGRLTGARAVAVRPDGNSLYVASADANAVSHFFVAPQGQLTFDGCVADDASAGCTAVGTGRLTGAFSVAVRPDGNSVYVASPGANSVSYFLVAPQGQLTFGGCIADDASAGCTAIGAGRLTGARAVAVSPDGNSVYVASSDANSVSHFFVAPQGQLTFGGCVADDATAGCSAVGAGRLTGARGVAVSPDGNSVYVASLFADSVSHFFVAPQGQLTFDGCVADDASAGCAAAGSDRLTGAFSVAVRPNGGSVYVASTLADSVSHFFRATASTTTLPGTCPASATFGSLDCRLQALIDRIRGTTGLGAVQPNLAKDLDKAKTRTERAEAACAAGDGKRARRRLRQASGKMSKYGRRLGSAHAVRKVAAAVREPLAAEGDAIRNDLDTLRAGLVCP